jgi:hypothetical protein
MSGVKGRPVGRERRVEIKPLPIDGNLSPHVPEIGASIVIIPSDPDQAVHDSARESNRPQHRRQEDRMLGAISSTLPDRLPRGRESG